MSAPVRIALIGAGAMGAHHARVVFETDEARLRIVVDADPLRADKLADQVGCRAASSVEAAFDCDAAIVAVPTESHEEVALALMEAGVPVLVEKPLAGEVVAARRIVAASERTGVPLMCGFVERFNPGVVTARSILTEAPVHMVALRHSPPTPRIATSVVHDLLIHDIDLAMRFVGEEPVEETRGLTFMPPGGRLAEVADCVLRFAGGAIALLSSSRTSQRKVRAFNVETPTSLVEIDLLRQDVTVYRHVRHEQVVEGSTAYRAETIVDIPFVRHAGEPLALQLQHFLRLIDGRGDPDGERRWLLPPHESAERILRWG